MKYLVVQAFSGFDQGTDAFRHRIRNPGASLKTHPSFEVMDMHVFHPLFPQLAMTADVLIFHLLPDKALFRIIFNRRRMGKPTVFEIGGNFLSPAEDGEDHQTLRHPEVRQRLLYFASLCDGVQFSTHEAAKTFGFLNKNHIVLENYSIHFSDRRPPRKPVVLGLSGSKGEESGLADIAPVIIGFCRRHKDVQFHFMGYPPLFHRYFDKLAEKQKRLIQREPGQDQSSFLENIHIGIAPMVDCEANRCRSDMPFLEFASHGVVPLVADAAPFRTHARHGENALLFRSPEELACLLEELYRDHARLETLSQAALRFARIKRNLANHLGRRVVFLEKLLKHEPFLQNAPPLPDCSGLITYLRRASQEYLLGQYREAADILEKVLQLHPGYQLAHVWKARTLIALEKYKEVLQAYAAFKIDPIYFDLFLESLTIAAQKLENPLWREFHNLIVDPVLKAELDLTRENSQETHLRAILKHNPFHYQSLVDLGKILAIQRDPECADLFRRALFITPESGDLALLHQHALALTE